MKDIKKEFLRTMVREIGYAEDHGFLLSTPITMGLASQEIKNIEGLILPQSLLDLYSQIANLKVLWEIFESDENTKQFREDSYLIEKYFENDCDWGSVKELLTGFINITNSNDIFDLSFTKKQAYYYTLEYKSEDESDFFPFDIQSDLTACLRKEGGTIVDNIWIVHTPAEKIYDMKVTVEQYLQLAYKAKCLYHWQLVYLFKDKAEEHEIMKRFLPKIFSHVELDLKDFGIQV